MTPRERETVVVAISQMLEGYGRSATELQLGAYLFVLEGVECDSILLAMQTIMRSGTVHPPTPGQVYQAALCGGDVEQRANEAWDVYEAAQRTVGGEYGVNFADGLINAVVRSQGGWSRCSKIPEEEFHVWHKKSWLADYKRFATCGVSRERTAGMRGSLPESFIGERVKAIPSPYVPGVLSIGVDASRRTPTLSQQLDSYDRRLIGSEHKPQTDARTP